MHKNARSCSGVSWPAFLWAIYLLAAIPGVVLTIANHIR